MLKLVKEQIAKSLGITADFDISIPEIKEFGHYSTNVAMRLARERQMPPLALAQEFARVIANTRIANNTNGINMFARAEAVTPGFINLWLSDEFLTKEFLRVSTTPYTLSPVPLGTVVIDQCGTNIAKPMHVGHMRSTIIGAALSNIYEALGYRAIRWNYLGDWGTQFGNLIAAYKLWGEKKTVEEKPIETLLALYIRFHEEMKNNPELEKRGQEEFKKLEEGDGENRKLWEWFKDESMLEFDKLYKRLGVRFDHNIGEEFYVEEMRPVVNELKEKRIAVPSLPSEALAKEGEGGYGFVAHLEKFNLPPALIQKSDGASLYITRDIASLKHRISKYKPGKLLYVVANEQALHFSQLFAIAKLLGITGGLNPDGSPKVELEHVKFGMVLGEDGKKLSTREGKAVKLEELLDKITELAYKVVSEKNPDLPEKEKQEVAEIVGIGALKYNDLKENRVSDITFNWERMLDFHGDSAPYLQYTAVRLMSIIRKAGFKGAGDRVKGSVLKRLFGGVVPKHNTSDLAAVTDEMKAVIMKKVVDYWDVVALCAQTNLTSHLAKYLFELAKLASQYYESVRILDDPSTGLGQDENIERRNGRLLLINSVAQTLTAGLKLLGIKVPERI